MNEAPPSRKGKVCITLGIGFAVSNGFGYRGSKSNSELGFFGLEIAFDLMIKARHDLGMTGKRKLPDVFAQDPQVMSGAMVFKGTRVPVQTFFDHLDHGGTLEEFLEWYDGVTRDQLETAEEIRTARTA